MTPKNIIPAAILAAMLATPAMACTDWKAVAAFDAVTAANDTRELARPKADAGTSQLATQHMIELEEDRDKALHDKCQENAQ